MKIGAPQTRLKPAEARQFRELALELLPERPEAVQDSLEVLGRAVDEGWGALGQLDRQGRVTALKLAINTFPPGPQSLLLSDVAYYSLGEVERVRSLDKPDSGSTVSLNGVSASLPLSPLQQPIDFLSAYEDFVELKELVEQGRAGRPGGGAQLEARNALKLELHHFHQQPGPTAEYRHLLGLTGSDTLAAWGVHRLDTLTDDASRPRAAQRLQQLRPGLENNEFFGLLQLAAEATDPVWQRVSDSQSYTEALAISDALKTLKLEPEPHWHEYADFSSRLQQQGLKEKQVLGLLDWTVENHQALKKALGGNDQLPKRVGDALTNSWRGQVDRGEAFLEQVLEQQQPEESWEAAADRVAEVHWLHGGFDQRDANLKKLEEIFAGGKLAADSLEAAAKEFEYRLRLERVVFNKPEEAAAKALAGLQTLATNDDIELDAVEDGMMFGDILVER